MRQVGFKLRPESSLPSETQKQESRQKDRGLLAQEREGVVRSEYKGWFFS